MCIGHLYFHLHIPEREEALHFLAKGRAILLNGIMYCLRLLIYQYLVNSEEQLTCYKVRDNSSHEAKHSKATIKELGTFVMGDSVVRIHVHSGFFSPDVSVVHQYSRLERSSFSNTSLRYAGSRS